MSAPPTVPLLQELAAHSEIEAGLGRRLWARPIVPEHDTDLMHDWMHRPHVVEFWEMAWPRDWIHDYLVSQVEDPARRPYLGFVDEVPVGYLEVYDPFRDTLAAFGPLRQGDLGAHVLIGDEEHLGRYSVTLGRAIMRMLFKQPDVLRIVGEPDVRNENFLSLLAFLGFRKDCELEMPDKRAAFMVCERVDFERLVSRRRSAAG